MSTREQLAALVGQAFANQHALNDKLRPDWHEQGWRYYRAIWTEMSEAIMHTNWAWWKTQNVDAPLDDAQAVELYIEFCDVLHFGLSLDIINSLKGGRTIEQKIGDYIDAFEKAATTEPLDECIEGVVVDAILIREFNIKKFARACYMSGLGLSGLLSFYFAKSALNEFRWSNGYKEKTYKKMWKLPGAPKAVEDNTVLGQLVTTLVRGNKPEDLIEGLRNGDIQNRLLVTLENKYATLE